ncbi:MAG: DUF1926 domain-containing protein [Planctomycetaceae bacterium]|nr:DUF1926 domain-containing protein [Planctomycetaceae bacterium]
MPRPVRFIFALHNHQPIGNFENVFEQAYQDSYLPFLDVYEPFDGIKLALHTSGSLIEWLEAKHPEYLDRVAKLVKLGRIEVIGGPFYEPILTMLPSRDRIGQIKKYKSWLEKRLGGTIRGMWVPERVWEQSMVRDLADAGMEYTILDDCHFRNACMNENQLSRHYLTEDDGRTMSVFPGSERLRYLIPFGSVEETIRYFAEFAEKHENAVLVHGDDGEKFGTWPNTSHHVYKERWLHRFFEALQNNADWLITSTPSEVRDKLKPLGKIYLPDGSYREMTEWVMPAERQNELENLQHDPAYNESLAARVKPFLRGGFWRNFKVRYPETDEMYSRMMATSTRLKKAIDNGLAGREIEEAREALYRGQCNCSYWHGAFGGVYLPHLRHAVYQQLIRADNLLDHATGKNASFLEADVCDFNFDGQKEIRIANNELMAWFAPQHGGTMYELDVREICHNLGATLGRRREAYHRMIRQSSGNQNNGNGNHDGDCSSIHDRIVFKQQGLQDRLQCDNYCRKCFVDLFYDDDVSFDAVRNGQQRLHSTFHESEYHATLYRTDTQAQLILRTEGNAYGAPIKLQKTITFTADSPKLHVLYQLSEMPRDYRLHFATELNFAGLPGGADDRYFLDADAGRLGHLGSQLDLRQTNMLGLCDEWLGIAVQLETSKPTDIYAFPVETVSQSEGGFELVQQSVALQPHWHIVPDAQGCWAVEMTLTLDTSRARQRKPQQFDRQLDLVAQSILEMSSPLVEINVPEPHLTPEPEGATEKTTLDFAKF